MLALAASPALGDDPPCRCRTRDGGYVPVGASACIETPKGPRIATCEMMQNNPSWRFTDERCPLASIREPGKRALAAVCPGPDAPARAFASAP